MENSAPKALLVLENGTVFTGTSFGHIGKALGEVCFNTSMSGYQEIITDPSYRGQLITFSYPMIGNYGIHYSESESSGVQAAGMIVKEYVDQPSNFRSQCSLGRFLQEHQTPGIQGIDTRRLVLMIRREGAQSGGIFPQIEFRREFLEEVRSLPPMEGLDLASQASSSQAYEFGEQRAKRFRLAVIDFGIKASILRLLDQTGFALRVFPAKTSFARLQAENFDCYFLSNGPGDPASLGYAVQTIKGLLTEGKPIFGICLGHQLLGLASGQQRFKLKFGHRGSNQPVRQEATGRVEITAQNHGFAIEAVTAHKAKELYRTHINLNDNTIEGFCSEEPPLMCVQYHPEASPGPHDSRYLFTDFYQIVEKHYANKN